MKICSIDECDRDIVVKGMCRKHYNNLRVYGHAVAIRDMPPRARIELVGWDVTDSGCWEWKGARNHHNYGIIEAARYGLKSARVHRVYYTEVTGECIDGLELMHKCDNPPCMNPDHLEPGTHAQNMRDMTDKGRHWMHGRTECPNGHDLTAPGAQKIVTQKGRSPYPTCVECARARSRRYAKKVRAHS